MWKEKLGLSVSIAFQINWLRIYISMPKRINKNRLWRGSGLLRYQEICISTRGRVQPMGE